MKPIRANALTGSSAGSGSLRTVHLVFIVAASLMALILVGWGFSTFRARDDAAALLVAAIGFVLFLTLVVYGSWMRRSR